MQKLFLAVLIFVVLFTGCNNSTQTNAPIDTASVPEQPAAQAATAETGTADNIAAADGDGVTEVGFLYPAYVDSGNTLKYGYINNKGAFVIKPQYEYVFPFEDSGLATVRVDNFEGVIDNSGQYVLQPEYDYISGIYEDVIVARNEEEGYILFNLKGDKLFVTNESIGSFSDGLAVYSQQTSDGTSVCGYIDKSGGIVIEPVFKEAYGFNKDKAVVRLQSDKYAVIDKKGNILKELDFNIIGNLSEGAFIYKTENEKFGYLAEDGSKLTEAIYTYANSFEDGYAVVNTSEDYSNPQYGLIDMKGKYVLEPKYGGITPLGQGRFSVSESTCGNGWDTFSKKAVFTDKGEQITDMAYYDISRFSKGISSVSTDTRTYIIGLDCRPIGKFGVMDGVGTVECIGDLIEADIDGDLIYLSMDGQTVWKSEKVFNLANGAVIKQNKYRPDRCLMIHYPVISNHPDTAVQDKLNSLLKGYFAGNNPVSSKEGGTYTEDTGADYSLSQVGGLLVIQHSSWYYMIGAAHGSSALSVYHLNTGNAKEYKLKDLFKSGSNYTGRITGLINRQISQSGEGDNSMYLLDKVETISPDQGFIITDKALQIYYQTYEIAAYAAGQPTFDIGYDDIIDLIDTEGELWKLIADSLKYGKLN